MRKSVSFMDVQPPCKSLSGATDGMRQTHTIQSFVLIKGVPKQRQLFPFRHWTQWQWFGVFHVHSDNGLGVSVLVRVRVQATFLNIVFVPVQVSTHGKEKMSECCCGVQSCQSCLVGGSLWPLMEICCFPYLPCWQKQAEWHLSNRCYTPGFALLINQVPT